MAVAVIAGGDPGGRVRYGQVSRAADEPAFESQLSGGAAAVEIRLAAGRARQADDVESAAESGVGRACEPHRGCSGEARAGAEDVCPRLKCNGRSRRRGNAAVDRGDGIAEPERAGCGNHRASRKRGVAPVEAEGGAGRYCECTTVVAVAEQAQRTGLHVHGARVVEVHFYGRRLASGRLAERAGVGELAPGSVSLTQPA